MQQEEIWKDIEGYEGLYQVSNLGRVRSLIPQGKVKCRILKLSLDKRNGHLRAFLYKNKRVKAHGIQRLVAMAFVDGYKPGLVVNHKDENPGNNRWDNLEWLTLGDNNRYGTAYSRMAETQGYPVEQLTIDGQFVASYYSISEASRQSGISFECIRDVINGRQRKAGGYLWRRVEKNEPIKTDTCKPRRVTSLRGEEWRDIKGYEGLYQVSNMGRVKALHYRQTSNEQLLGMRDWPRGYKKVHLTKCGHGKGVFVHRIVAEAFIGDVSGMEINHKDGNPSNNRAENLEIVTHQQNIDHSWQQLGRQIWSKGIRGAAAGRSRPVIAVDKDGVIVCRANTLQEMTEKIDISMTALIRRLKKRSIRFVKYKNLSFQYEERKKYKKNK